MRETLDPFDILRDLDPVATEELGNPAASPEARIALEQILARKRRPRLAAYPRRSRLIYVLLTIVLIAGVGAVAWALTERSGQRRTVGCYQTVDLQARTIVVAMEDSPIATCRAVWAGGELGKAYPARLEACVLPSGAIGVFASPTADACQTLGLVRSGRELRDASSAILDRLKDELVTAVLAQPCLGGARATAIVAAKLSGLGLTGWQVRTNGTFSPATPCASIAIDDARHLVLVVPVRNHLADSR